MLTDKKSSRFSKKYLLSCREKIERLEKKFLQSDIESPYLRSFLFYSFFNKAG